MKTQSQKFLRQRKFMLVFPACVLPFIILIFWALGGGKVTASEGNAVSSGLNITLPDAQLKNENADKLSFYQQAEKESLKLQEALKNDPYYKYGDTDNKNYSEGLSPTSDLSYPGIDPADQN